MQPHTASPTPGSETIILGPGVPRRSLATDDGNYDDQKINVAESVHHSLEDPGSSDVWDPEALAELSNLPKVLKSTTGPSSSSYLNQPITAPYLSDDPVRANTRRHTHGEVQSQSTDSSEINPDLYTPWLPQHDEHGVLIKLQTAAMPALYIFCYVFVFLLIVIVPVNQKILFRIQPAAFLYQSLLMFVLNISLTIFMWLPLVTLSVYLGRLPGGIRHSRFGIKTEITISFLLFGLACWLKYVCFSDNGIWSPWHVKNLPETYHGCQHRVADQQSALFTPGYFKYFDFTTLEPIFDRGNYHASFDNIFLSPPIEGEYFVQINTTLFQGIHNNNTLCADGFRGESDYYGIGIRIGLYLQWMAALLTNNLLPHSRTELQKVYLLFSLAICCATIITTIGGTCVFGVEIEILYWMYWGGYMCVFGSSPEEIDPEMQNIWVQLDWATVLLYVKHWVMIYHGIWFVWYGYDNFFARMPCGTYQFFLAPVLDPSERYNRMRSFLMNLFTPLAIALLQSFPLAAILLLTELKHAIQASAIYTMCFPRHSGTSESSNKDDHSSFLSSISRGVRNTYHRLEDMYGTLRGYAGLPRHSREGIRLITQLDIEHRRQSRIRYALLGLVSFGLPIAAIELTLKWNKVVGINDLAATGQYISLIIGAGCLISVLWRLILQESERRSQKRIQQILDQEHAEEYIELDTLSTRFSDAIQHAFAQRDVEFLRNRGVLPTVEPVPNPGNGDL